MRFKKIPPQEKRCQTKRKGGLQCRAARLKGEEYCLFHHPWTQRQRERFNKVEQLPLREKADIHETLADAVRGVKSGKMKAPQAYALGWLLRQLRENLPGVEEERARYEKNGLLGEREPEFGKAKESSAEENPEDEAAPDAGERSDQLAAE